MNEWAPDEADDGVFSQFDLGDALAKDDGLRESLPFLKEQVNDDAPETSRIFTTDLLALVRSPATLTIASVRQVVAWVQERFEDRETRKARISGLRADAALKRAKARAIDAESKLRLAKAHSVSNASQLTLLERLKEMGIDWRADLNDDGRLLIVVTKKKRRD